MTEEAATVKEALGADSHDEEVAANTSTQACAVVGEHCVTDRPLPSGQSPNGEVVELNGIDVYVSKPMDYPHKSSKLLLLLTGGTGIKSLNNQLQADKFAAEGFVVVMPDLFGGDPAPNSGVIQDEDLASPGSLLDRVKLKAVEAARSFMIDMWLARHTEEKVMPILHKVVDGCHNSFVDAIKAGQGIYAAGYCIGGRYVLLLGSERARPTVHGQALAEQEAGEIKKGPAIKVGAVAHASSVNPGDFTDLVVPVTLVCVENDPLFPDEVRIAGEELMSKANLEHAVTIYPGVPHGFAVVGEYGDSSIRDAQATAYEQMLHWLKVH